jgi:hypothetical protein
VLKHARVLQQLQQLLEGSVRMAAGGLLETLHQAGFAELRGIDIRVAPLVEQEAVQRNDKPLSAAARQALALMARLGTKGGE